MIKLLYRPFGIVLGLIAGFLSKSLFNFIWSRIDDEEAPKATIEGSTWPKVLISAAVQGMVFQTVRAAVNRGGAEGFQYLTGVWPGEKQPDPEVTPTGVAVLVERLGLSDEELLTVLDADPLSVLSGDLEHRPEVPILLALTEDIDVAVLRRWLRASSGLDLLLRRDFAGFEDAVDELRDRGLVIRARR